MLFENLRAVIDVFSHILISSEICGTAPSSLEGRVVPRTGGDLSSEYFGVGNRADKFLTDFSTIFERSPLDHVKASITDSTTCR